MVGYIKMSGTPYPYLDDLWETYLTVHSLESYVDVNAFVGSTLFCQQVSSTAFISIMEIGN